MCPSAVIELPLCHSFRGIAFDGCFFYLTAPLECAVYKFTLEFIDAGSVTVGRPFTAICYDTTDKCFWAAEDKCNDVIYKLDRCLKEIGQQSVKSDKKFYGPIQGISYDCKQNVLLTAYQDYIVEISKQSGRAHILRRNCPGDYTAILSIAPYYAIVQTDLCQSKKKQEILFYSQEGCLLRSFNTSDKYKIEDILFYPCPSLDSLEYELIILVTITCENQGILRYNLKACDIAPDCCNHQVCNEECDEECNDECNDECSDECNDECDETCEKQEPCKSACCDLLGSVALLEAALAHILNAEGEKIQKAVKIAHNVNEMIEVNHSVNEIILSTAALESLLINKLEAINNIC